MSSRSIEQYLSLISAFVSGEIAASEFENRYLELFKSDETIREEAVFLVLDRLFSDVDVFCADSAIRGVDNLDENELRLAASHAYDRLKKLI